MIMALCCLHNFIRLESDGNDKFDNDKKAVDKEKTRKKRTYVLHREITAQERKMANNLRDKIAEDMWVQYTKYIETRV